jgi:hypothetical protein
MSGLAQGIKRSLSPGLCLTDAIGVVRSASALIGGIASQFGGEWPKVATKMPAFEHRVGHAVPQGSRAHASEDNAASLCSHDENPLNPWVERAQRLFQYIRGTARRASGEREIIRADLAPHPVGLDLERDPLALG